MSPHKNLWYGAVAVAGILLLASQSYRVADARAAREKTIVSAAQARDTICWHDDFSVYHGCGDFFDPAAVKSVTVTVTYTDGRAFTATTSGVKADAVFLSKSAAQNFLVRYYRAKGETKKLQALAADMKTAKVH